MLKKLILITNLFFLFVSVFFFAYTTSNNLKYPIQYEEYIIQYASKYQLSQSLVSSLIFAESSYNTNATSKSNAQGLMQIKPETAMYILQKNNSFTYTENCLYNAEINIEIGCMYLRYLFDKFFVEKTVLCAYNAGEGTVSKWLNNKNYSYDSKNLLSIPYLETQNYVLKINTAKNFYNRYYKN